MKTILTVLLLTIHFMCYAQHSEIYVSDAGNFQNPPWQILKFDAQGGSPSVFISQHLNWPQDILFLEDSNLVLISNLGSGCISKHDATTGAFLGNFACGIGGPTRLKIGVDSLIYVLQWSGNGKVRRYHQDGTFLGDFTSQGVNQSIGMDWDEKGNLYVSSYTGDLVHKFDTAGLSQGVFINTNLAGPTNIWFDFNGDLLVVDYDATSVKRFDSTGTFKGNFITGLGNAEGVDTFPNGNILIGNGATSSVKMFNSSGTFLGDFVAPGVGNLLNPNAVVIRNSNQVALPERAVNSKTFLYPSIGISFQLMAELTPQAESIEIYDQSGRQLLRIENFLTNQLNFSLLQSGIYIAVLKTKDAKIISQRIQIL